MKITFNAAKYQYNYRTNNIPIKNHSDNYNHQIQFGGVFDSLEKLMNHKEPPKSIFEMDYDEIKSNLLKAQNDAKSLEQFVLQKIAPEGVNFLWHKNNENVKLVLDTLKTTPKIQEKFILEKDKDGNSVLFCNNLERVTLIIDSIKDNPRLLKKFLLQKDKDGDSILAYNNLGILTYIIESTKDNPELLGEVLSQTNKAGDNVLICDDYKKAKLVLDAIKDKPKLLEKMLLSTNHQGIMPTHIALTETTKEIIKAIENNPELTEKVLTSLDYDGDTILSYGDKLEKGAVVLNALKNRYDLLEKLLLSKNADGEIPVQVLIPKASIFILKNIQDNLYLLKKVIQTPNDNGETFLNSSYEDRAKEINYRLANEPELRKNIEIAKKSSYEKLFRLSAKYMANMKYMIQNRTEDENIKYTIESKADIPNIFYLYN